MRTLASYLSENEISQNAFAKRIGMSRSYLNEILWGLKTPSLPLAMKIEDATGGKVKARSLQHAQPSRAVNQSVQGVGRKKAEAKA